MRFNPEQLCGLCGKRCRDHADRVDHERVCGRHMRSSEDMAAELKRVADLGLREAA